MIVRVLGAGGPAGVNVCRALYCAGHDVQAVDTNTDRLIWCEPYAHHEWNTHEPDVTWAQPDPLVLWLSENRDLNTTLLPDHDVLERLQDKHATIQLWADAGLRTGSILFGPETPDYLQQARYAFGLPFWLRARHGAGARAATLVQDPTTGWHWIRYWASRGEHIEWVAEEYLPGRDYCWSSLWYEGKLIAAFTRRRDEWLYPQNSPSGITGTPTIATIVHDDEVAQVARAAVLVADKTPHGAYAVDLREDREGRPTPTEINAGRWPTTTPLYAEIGPNLPDLAVRLAVGGTVDPLGDNIYPDGVRLFRHIDCPATFTRSPNATHHS